MSFTYKIFCFSAKMIMLTSFLATLKLQRGMWPLGRVGSPAHANHGNYSYRIFCVLSNKATWSLWASRKKLLGLLKPQSCWFPSQSSLHIRLPPEQSKGCQDHPSSGTGQELLLQGRFSSLHSRLVALVSQELLMPMQML